MRRKQPRISTESPFHHVLEFTLMVVGSFVIAASFNLFLSPNKIASGGVSGISIILHQQLGVQPAITQWAFNIPLFIAGMLLLGRKFALKTAVGSIVLPLFVLLTQHWPALTSNSLLAAIYGGIGVGTGLGIVFRGKGSTGGMDLAAQIIHKYTELRLGLAVALLDGMVILTAGIVFSAEIALYALIGLFVTSKTIDLVQAGFSISKVAFIISNEPEAVRTAVVHDLDRGITRLSGYGGYTGDEKTIWMVVVGQTEVAKLKALVKAADPNAFVILSDATEVLGEGFKLS